MVDVFVTIYDVPAVAQKLRVNQTTVTRWCRTGVLKQGEDFFVLPRRGSRHIYRFTQEQFDRLIGNSPEKHSVQSRLSWSGPDRELHTQ